ncbi:hypothetical protein GCM10009007_10050 [Formosimonas limnophila]|uniref:DUF3644 domain-containing protein n=1 Tax=Formosimonas limnophila TaxID=1384487 RepID=A0A8J3CMM6_9BURK|nr:DUF3644 domain-containing protein [Formosimonas limnophila]GHA71162.1 hypothetical protein GCM10009007_10050 [Formosimonas limnophila]
MVGRVRRVGSISNELLKKSKEAALAAVQIFNNPVISFKSEAFIVLMNIAWTYLLHAYFRKMGVEYRFYTQRGNRKIYDKTKYGAKKHWELERCLNTRESPIQKDVANNLKFLIGFRHEIEHQMTTKIDDFLSARFQACCLNYNEYIKKLFEDDGIEKHLSFSLQFSSIDAEQIQFLQAQTDLPANIHSYITEFDEELTDDEYNSPKYAYRIFFVPKLANKKGQADKVIEFVKSDSDFAKDVNKQYAVIKETEKEKYLPKQIVVLMQSEGFDFFTMHEHTKLWKIHNAKAAGKNFGVSVAGGSWYWYDSWLKDVRHHCQSQFNK